ncbi:hypothetical protein AZ046_005287, partial [Klebsiella pneumoniae]
AFVTLGLPLPQGTVETVSYTHLDVYKRQAQWVLPRANAPARNLLDKAFVTLGPVSYTHLDVYKRQIRTRAASWRQHPLLSLIHI